MCAATDQLSRAERMCLEFAVPMSNLFPSVAESKLVFIR